MHGNILLMSRERHISHRVLAASIGVPEAEFSRMVYGRSTREFSDEEKRIVAEKLRLYDAGSIDWLFMAVEIPPDYRRRMPGE